MLSDNKISKSETLVILDDLGWHHRDEFLTLARDISPEIASRTYVLAVPAKAQQARREQDLHVQTKLGRHRAVDNFLKSLRHNGTVESRGQGGYREFRLAEANGDPRFVPLSCPCCPYPENDPFVGQSGPNRHVIECRTCHIKIERETKPQVIRAWNSRNVIKIEEVDGNEMEFEQGAGI